MSCLICDQEQAPSIYRVFDDGEWAASVVPGYAVPGWLILRLKRHALGWPRLSASELAAFGRRVRDVMGAIKAVTAAEATYLMVFGENYPHFHALITPRMVDTPDDRRGADIIKLRATHLDLTAALAFVPAIATEYGALSKNP